MAGECGLTRAAAAMPPLTGLDGVVEGGFYKHAAYVKLNIMLSGVSAMVRRGWVGNDLDVPRTIADTLPLN